MKMYAVLPMFIVALCAAGCFGSGIQNDLPSWTQFGAYCYLVSSEIKNQPEAKTWCRDQGQGADLVKINSAEENEFVLQLVRQRAPSLKQVWIGLEWRRSTFYWSDLSAPVFTRWAPNEPNNYNGNEECSHMYVGGYPNELPGRASGYWNDIICRGLKGYPNGIVCKRLCY